MTTTKAHIRASAKYNKANYAEIKLYVKKDEKETIKAIAAEQGMSVNSFITTAIDYYLSNHCPSSRDILPTDATEQTDPTPQKDT
ncbi:MAG: hypothetical protein IJT87_13380 [Ruminiclostridium sp.]|nr:hypothetical protein [Ruminiclostridium sp.]